MPDRDIQAVAREIHQRAAGHHLEIDVGMGVLELLQARHQPSGREERCDAYGQQAGIRGHRDAPGGLRDLPESVADRRQVILSGVGQEDAAVHPVEQLDPEVQLERLEHLAHRARSDAQLLGGVLHREMPRRGLESAERVQRRQLMPAHLAHLF
jgi:hypothetical protein